MINLEKQVVAKFFTYISFISE